MTAASERRLPCERHEAALDNLLRSVEGCQKQLEAVERSLRGFNGDAGLVGRVGELERAAGDLKQSLQEVTEAGKEVAVMRSELKALQQSRRENRATLFGVVLCVLGQVLSFCLR